MGTIRLAKGPRKPKKPANRRELTARLAPTVTGGLEVTFTDVLTYNRSGKKRTEKEKTQDTFNTVSGAVQAVDLRIADFVETIRKEDDEIGPLFGPSEKKTRNKKEAAK